MESIRIKKGLCVNLGFCSKAMHDEIIEISDPQAPFICPECGNPLKEIVEKRKLKISPELLKKIGIGSGIGVGVLLLVFGCNLPCCRTPRRDL